jgi:hypothetical protein
MPMNQLASLPFDRPVFIVAAPRSGSTMLFELLARAPKVWTVGGESHGIIEGLPQLSPAGRDYSSNRLTAADADPGTVAALRHAFFSRLRDRDGHPVSPADGPVRLLEKTPKNALRISFLAAAFPGAKFIALTRKPAANIGSILDAWLSQRFVTYPNLPGWTRPRKWSLLLIEGWRELATRPLVEIAATQWHATNCQLLDDLALLPSGAWCAVDYDEICRDLEASARALCAFAEWTWDAPLREPLPLSRHTLTAPAPEKWRRHEALIAPLLPQLAPLSERIATARRTQPPVAHPSP